VTEDAVVACVLAAVTPRTRLAILDHVTSPTGLVLPVERLVTALAERGVDVLVDGAHALGQVPLALEALGAAYYTSNCHKWLCAPKGAAILWARADRREGLHPTSISHGYNWPTARRSRFRLEFDWTGTDDPTAALAVPAALTVVGGLLTGGWPAVMARNRGLALAGRARVAAALGVALPCPDSMIGALAALPLPPGPPAPPGPPPWRDPLADALHDAWGIEIPIVAWPAHPARLVRLSAQLYNAAADYDRLARALTSLLPAHGGSSWA
jgi:isopenicillin-N epimerase